MSPKVSETKSPATKADTMSLMGAPEAVVGGRRRCLFVANASFVAAFVFGDESYPLLTMFFAEYDKQL